jgi:hypothetical protein
MPRRKNKYGLSDYIPRKMQKEIKRRCGFGCVICGNAIYTFEHFDPPFEDLTELNANGITLLCWGHQGESSKGLLSKATISNADKNPCCKQSGYSKHIFDLGNPNLNMILGGSLIECGPRMVVDENTIFEVFPPENKSHRWTLSAEFRDPKNRLICKIERNELSVSSESSNFEQTARTFSIFYDGVPFLVMELEPPHSLHIHKYRCETDAGTLTIDDDAMMFLAHSGEDLTIRRSHLRFPLGLNVSTKNGIGVGSLT